MRGVCDAVPRGSRWAAQLCQLCAEICEACAAECDKHDNDHCRACAESCRRCAQECRARPDQHLKLSRTSAVQRSGSREQCHGHGRAVVVLDSLVV
ncbi:MULTISPECIES: four-helix bundle copper-binding protein [Mycobacterium]|nr:MULTISPECIES: four-helix bundle copper-binding protein [Mycobacterium]